MLIIADQHVANPPGRKSIAAAVRPGPARLKIASPSPTMPAAYILPVLGLADPQVVLEPENHPQLMPGPSSGTSVIRLEMDGINSPELRHGLLLLQDELSNPDFFKSQDFDFVFNEQGDLIAIFPAITEELRLAITLAQSKQLNYSHLKYLDLTPYYFEVPQANSSAVQKRWATFLSAKGLDRTVLLDYIERMSPGMTLSSTLLAQHNSPFYHLGQDHDQKWQVTPIPCSSLSANEHTLGVLSARHGFIFTVFPFVYSPANSGIFATDQGYHHEIISNANIDIHPDHRVLVGGPGSGIDSFFASQHTNVTIHAFGINPFEIANLGYTATVASFRASGIVADNLISTAGRPIFGGQKFQRIIWNMPAYRQKNCRHARLADYWDGDLNGLTLRRFAQGLTLCLEPGGKALIWNTKDEAVINIIEEAHHNSPFPFAVRPLKASRCPGQSDVYQIEFV